jgi:hypothetical protein
MNFRASKIVLLTIFAGLHFSQAETQEASNIDQDIYVLSEKVQQFGKENQVYTKLGTPDKVTLYVNTLTAIDVIAEARSSAIGRKTQSDDYEFAGWLLCILPWTPPKAPPDVARMTALRPKIVTDAFISSTRRKEIAQRLNLKLLRLSAQEIKGQHLSPFSFMETKDLP